MNFQQMIIDLTGMDIANASLLDESTAAAEAMMMAYKIPKKTSNTLLFTKYMSSSNYFSFKNQSRILLELKLLKESLTMIRLVVLFKILILMVKYMI